MGCVVHDQLITASQMTTVYQDSLAVQVSSGTATALPATIPDATLQG
jgi:hypothetical protein